MSALPQAVIEPDIPETCGNRWIRQSPEIFLDFSEGVSALSDGKQRIAKAPRTQTCKISSGHISSLSAAADAVGLVPEILPISRCRFRVLVDRNDDGLDVVIAPPFPCRLLSNLLKRL
jgi:hypothetical protein